MARTGYCAKGDFGLMQRKWKQKQCINLEPKGRSELIQYPEIANARTIIVRIELCIGVRYIADELVVTRSLKDIEPEGLIAISRVLEKGIVVGCVDFESLCLIIICYIFTKTIAA